MIYLISSLALAICTAMFFRIQYLRGYIVGQKLGAKQLSKIIDRQAELIEQQQTHIDYLTEVVLDMDDNNIDAQAIVNKILNQ